MPAVRFNTDSFRDLTFDLLSGIANHPKKLGEFTTAYLGKLQQRTDEGACKQYTREIYEKILSLQTVQIKSDLPVKDSFQDRILVIYFWTFSDIHSSHMMPKLATIDKRYSSADVAVLSVHSPKYEHEKPKINIRHAVEEQSLQFTVVNDTSLQAWKHVGCQIWPTVLVFGPDCQPIFIFEGENHVQHLDIFLSLVVAHYKPQLSSLSMKNFSADMFGTWTRSKAMNFTYPSHVCVTSHGHLCISYAGSNQLVFCQMDGKVLEVVGNGQAGMADGDIHQAEFDSPHGLVEYNSCIYVADTNNHAIRVFDPMSRRVLTLIGTGRLGSDKIGGLKRSQQPIASPWDLCITESPFDHKTVLLISMAGQHQIWIYAFEETHWWNQIVLAKNSCSAIIGNGIEGNRNGSEPMSVSLAAPRGICNGTLNGQPVLFIADSNSSSIRVVTLKEGLVTNLIGSDADPTNLSAFGDLDGTSYSAKLQHPLGVAFHYPTSQLYITDTFNNKLKRIDTNTHHCSSYFPADMDMGEEYGESLTTKFCEPQGLAIFDHWMFVADKNNSQIKRIDLYRNTVARCRFDLSVILNEERLFASKQAYLTISLPHSVRLREGNAGSWIIEDKDRFRICDGELTRSFTDQILLDYIPRDKQVAHLKYQLIVCEDGKYSMMAGEVAPINQTDYLIEFLIHLERVDGSIF